MDTHGTQAVAHTVVRGSTIDELWLLVRAMTKEPVTLELRPYFIDTAEGHFDLEEVTYGVRLSCTGSRLTAVLDRLRSEPTAP